MNEISNNIKHLMENRSRIPPEGFSELIAKILAPLNGVGWELGPDINNENKYTLALSIGFNKKHIDTISRKIEFPLQGTDWSITIGVPPKDWDLFFIIKTGDGINYEIDGSLWRFLDHWDGLKASIVFIPPLDWSFNEEITNESMKVFLSGSLGELNVIEFIRDYRVSNSPNETENSFGLQELRHRFVNVVENCHYVDFLKSHY